MLLFLTYQPMIEVEKILEAIQNYGLAYGALQTIQEESDLIPEGDQKTGCIGEFYVYQYLARHYLGADLKYGDHSQQGWDIDVNCGTGNYKVQVKTVSAYSKTRGMSPLHDGWDKLFVVYLDRSFEPQGFWIIDHTKRIFCKKKAPLKGLRCPHPDTEKNQPGSKSICFGDNQIEKLRWALNS